MRACPDDELPLPYLTWIDANKPLDDVELIPRYISPGMDLLAFTSSLISFGGMGVFLLYFSWRILVTGGDFVMPVILGLISIAIFAVPWLLAGRWLRALSAASEQRQGRLRRGILLGPEGLLVRLDPDQCYAVGWDRFVEAEDFYLGAGGSVFKIETLDGPVQIPGSWLRTTVSGFEKAVERHRPATGRPKVIPRNQRQHRVDLGPQRRLLRLVVVFFSGGAVLMASTAGVVTNKENTPIHDWAGLGVFIGLLIMLSMVPYAFWVLYRLSKYNCPQCSDRLPRADKFRPNIYFYCARCGINWDTKMSEGKMTHSS